MVTLLIDHGADINAGDVFLTTALHWASAGNQQAIAERLIEAGADINSKGRWIQPPDRIGCTLGTGAHKLRNMSDDELKEFAGNTQTGAIPPVLKREYGRTPLNEKYTFSCTMPTLALPWSLGDFPEIEQMLGGFGYSALTPLDVAYGQEELAEMTMFLAAHGARLASELTQQEEQ
jgi:hypothetical protein